jgi:hypothetical protein
MPTLGETLQAARAERQLTPAQVELDTRIRASVIEALEAGDYAHLPPLPFLRGLLKTYAAYLKLNPAELLDLYALETGQVPAPPPTSRRAPRAVPPPAVPPPEPLPQPPPSAPPELETLPPVENVPLTEAPAQPPPTPPTLVWRIGPLGLHAEILLGVIAAIIVVAAFGGFFYTRWVQGQGLVVISATPTPPATPAPTLKPTAPTQAVLLPPTAVPTFAATLAPIPTEAISRTPSPRPTRAFVASEEAPILVDMDIAGPITLWVVADGQEIIKANLDSGTKTFSAHRELFIQVENLMNANVILNGKRLGAKTFDERKLWVRTCTVDAAGKVACIVGGTPTLNTPTATITATRTATAPTTDTPLATSTAAAQTPTPTPTPPSTASPTPTPTPTNAASPTPTRF